MIIEQSDIFRALRRNGKHIPGQILMPNQSFFCPKKEVVSKYIIPAYFQWLQTLSSGFWSTQWDCDNFADAFKIFSAGFYKKRINKGAEGIAIGTIHYFAKSRAENGTGGAHAINIIFGEKDDIIQLWFVEPQNGEFLLLTPEEYKSIWMLYI